MKASSSFPHCVEIAKGIIDFKASIRNELILFDEKGGYVVWHRETNISSYKDAEQLQILFNVLQEEYSGTVWNASLKIRVGMSKKSLKKIIRYSRNNQRNIALYAKELMEIGFPISESPYKGGRRTDVRKVIYLNSRIKIGDSIFSVCLNVFESAISGYQLYDINKIAQMNLPG